MQEIRTAIIGVGNCASSLVQGRFYYKDPDADIPGLITKNLGGATEPAIFNTWPPSMWTKER